MTAAAAGREAYISGGQGALAEISKKIAKKIKINLQLKKKYVSLHPLSREQQKIIDNTERDNEVKKEKDIVCMKADPRGSGVMRG